MENKNINDMNAVEVGEFLNTGLHNHPIILKHKDGYNVHYSEVDENGLRTYKFEPSTTLKKAYKIFKKLD